MLLLFTKRVKETCGVSDQSSVEPRIVVNDLGFTAEVLPEDTQSCLGWGCYSNCLFMLIHGQNQGGKCKF